MPKHKNCKLLPTNPAFKLEVKKTDLSFAPTLKFSSHWHDFRTLSINRKECYSTVIHGGNRR